MLDRLGGVRWNSIRIDLRKNKKNQHYPSQKFTESKKLTSYKKKAFPSKLNIFENKNLLIIYLILDNLILETTCYHTTHSTAQHHHRHSAMKGADV
jgi:hypothetical protein